MHTSDPPPTPEPRYLPDDTPDIVSFLLRHTNGHRGAVLFGITGVAAGLWYLTVFPPLLLVMLAAIFLLVRRNPLGWYLCTTAFTMMYIGRTMVSVFDGGALLTATILYAGVIAYACRRSVRSAVGVSSRSAAATILVPFAIAVAGVVLPVVVIAIVMSG